MSDTDWLDKILTTHLNEIKAGHDGKLKAAITQRFQEEIRATQSGLSSGAKAFSNQVATSVAVSSDEFYGQLDNIMMWCFTLGFDASRREYGDQYKSAREAEPFYEDNLDSWIQDIMTSHDELVEAEVLRGKIEVLKQLPHSNNIVGLQTINDCISELDERVAAVLEGQMGDSVEPSPQEQAPNNQVDELSAESVGKE